MKKTLYQMDTAELKLFIPEQVKIVGALAHAPLAFAEYRLEKGILNDAKQLLDEKQKLQLRLMPIF